MCSFVLEFFVIFFLFLIIEISHGNIGDTTVMFDGYYEYFDGNYNDTAGTQLFDVNDNTFDYTTTSKSKSRYSVGFHMNANVDDTNEPPLLEELEIYPEQILEKALIMINPFGSDEFAMGRFLIDVDLSGPLFFCFLFGSFLFLAGKVFIFGHMYGLMVFSVLGLYGLLIMMSYAHQMHFITIKGVASALGYGMQHLIWLSFVGIFMRLDTFTGSILAATAIILATCGTYRILALMMNQSDKNNTINALIAYPTAIIYTVFVFLVVF